MPRAPKLWFRMYVEAFSDPKMLSLTPTERWAVAGFFAAARISPEPGKLLIAPSLPHDSKSLSLFVGVGQREVNSALRKAQVLGIITKVDDTFGVVNFEQRQYISDTSAPRMRDLRERQNAPKLEVVTSQPRHDDRHSDGRSDVPETETETETEPKTEKNTSPSERRARKRATRIPEGYKPNTLLIPGVDEITARRELEKFRDYWAAQPGSKGVKLDWEATWRNWLRRVAEQRPTKPSAVNNPAFGGW